MEELKNFIEKLNTEQEVYGDYDIASDIKEELLKIKKTIDKKSIV